MKNKFLPLMMLLCFACFGAARADVVQIGSTGTYGDLPLKAEFPYYLTQQIYDADEIGTPGTISVISLYAFQNCTALTSVTLPPTVTKIEYEAFMNCGLTGTLTLPDAVTTIEQDAFSYCRGLTGLVIGSGVTSIGSLAFYNCTGLESITIEAVNPPTLGVYNPFNQVPENIPVYVPCNTLADYQAAAGWNEFTNLIDPCATVTQTIELSAGINWFSTYVDITLQNLKDALVEALPGTTGIKIISQNGTTTWNGSSWRGNIPWNVMNMYMIQVPIACEISLEGLPVNPAEHPVTIKNGINWIAFPLSESMTLLNTFSGFAVSGDRVISQSGTSGYNGSTWRGSFSSLVPGKGYIYKSAHAETRTFTFPVGAK